MKLTIFSANCVGNAANALYPNKAEISNADDMIAVIARDHVCAEFKRFHRSVDDFIYSDVEVIIQRTGLLQKNMKNSSRMYRSS